MRSNEIDRGFGVDTKFVAFFMAMDAGQSIAVDGIERFLVMLTLSLVVVLPYFLPAAGRRPAFSRWLGGRLVAVAAAYLVGLAIAGPANSILPESLRYWPFTLLIMAAMISCYMQFHMLFRLRLAK